MLSILSVLLFSFIDTVKEWDFWIFIKINTEWTSSFLDVVAPIMRNKYTWIPLYVFLVIFAFYNFRKKAWFWLLFAGITIALTDQLSSKLIKNLVARPRPCRAPELEGHIRLMVSGCSGGYSFTSSHAANHFGIALFFFVTLKPFIKNWAWLFIVWAAVISYSQVYVGVHYFFDIVGGSIVGILSGLITSYFFEKYFGLGDTGSKLAN